MKVIGGIVPLLFHLLACGLVVVNAVPVPNLPAPLATHLDVHSGDSILDEGQRNLFIRTPTSEVGGRKIVEDPRLPGPPRRKGYGGGWPPHRGLSKPTTERRWTIDDPGNNLDPQLLGNPPHDSFPKLNKRWVADEPGGPGPRLSGSPDHQVRSFNEKDGYPPKLPDPPVHGREEEEGVHARSLYDRLRDAEEEGEREEDEMIKTDGEADRIHARTLPRTKNDGSNSIDQPVLPPIHDRRSLSPRSAAGQQTGGGNLMKRNPKPYGFDDDGLFMHNQHHSGKVVVPPPAKPIRPVKENQLPKPPPHQEYHRIISSGVGRNP